jgi:hypothetical protein
VIDKPENQRAKKSARLAERDLVQIEFLIEDLVKQLEIDRISPIANCNGCNACSGAIDLTLPQGEKQ